MNHNISAVRKKLRFADMPFFGPVGNAETQCNSEGIPSSPLQLPINHTNGEDMEVPGPSRTYQEHAGFVIRSDSGSDTEFSESNGSCSSLKRIETEQTPSDHENQEDMVAPRPCPSMLPLKVIFIGSDSEDDLPSFNGSQLVTNGEGMSPRDSSVPSTPSGLLKGTLSSPSRTCNGSPSSSTDSSGSRTPEILRTVSLSGFPKKNRKRKRKRNNLELEDALLTMHSDERNAYSQLYDEVGGSLSMSQDITAYRSGDEQMENSSNVIVEDIPKEQHTGTYERSDGSNLRIAVPESRVAIETPEGQYASSTRVHDATSILQLPKQVSAVTSSPSGQPIITNKFKYTDNFRYIVFHPADVTNGIEKKASTNSKMLISPQSAGSADGETNAKVQPKNISNGKDKLVSTGALYPNPTKPLDDQPLSSNSTNKSSDKEQNSLNINKSNKQHNEDAKKKDSMMVELGKMEKTHEKPHLHFSRHALSISKDEEHVDSPSVSKTSNEQPSISQFTSKSSEDQCKYSPGVSKTSDKQPTRTVITTTALVSSHNSDVSVNQTANVPERQSQSTAHLSATTTGTDLLIGKASSSFIPNNKGTEVAVSSPRAKDTSNVKETPKKDAATSREDAATSREDAATSREEAPPASPGTRSGKATENPNEKGYLNAHRIKTLSAGLRQGDFHKKFSHISALVKSTGKSIMTPQSRSQSIKDDVVFKPTSEPSIAFKQAGIHMNDVDKNLKNSDAGTAEDEPADDPLEDEFMLVEPEITHADENIVPHSDATQAALPTTKSSQTEISSGFPGKVEKPMNLNIDQKNQLLESYKETQKLMSRTGDMKADFEQAFAILQASGCFADFINGTEEVKDQGELNQEETPNGMESEPPETSSTSKKEGQYAGDGGHDKITSAPVSNKVMESSGDKDHNKKQKTLSESSSKSSRKEKSSGDEDHGGMQWELFESSSLESSRKEKSSVDEDHGEMQCKLLESTSESIRKEKSSGNEDHGGIQCELFESSSESSRKEKSSGEEDHGGMECELFESTSESSSIIKNKNLMEEETSESSNFSANSRSDRILPENTSGENMTSEVRQFRTIGTQTQILYPLEHSADGDTVFATNLIQFLRQIPEDKKLSTQISILNVLSSVLNQQTLSI